MRNLLKLGGAAVGGLFLASCVTYPYDTAFSSCESEANACYRLCEDIPDEGGYVACQAHCDRDIDRCFDQAYSPYSSGYGYGYGGGYGYSSPWYGQYGSWYPGSGYYLSFNYYDRYGHRKRHHPHPGGGGDWNNNHPPGGNNPPPNTNPPPRGEPRIPPGEREFDRPRKPNRYYRPNNSAPSGSPSASPAPQPTYTPPPRQPRRVTPSEPQPSQPAYTPPPASPPASSTPPPNRNYDNGGRPRTNSPRNSDEGNRHPD